MMKTRWLFLPLLFVLVLFGTPYILSAGINPASPGLPSASYEGVKSLTNNQFSAICVDCHSRVPVRGTNPGSHFVSRTPDATDPNDTSSGGGWASNSQEGLREDGQYFKITEWGTSGDYRFSKYGDLGTDTSVTMDNTNTNHTASLESTAANYADKEIICESCHSIIRNAQGGNNLLYDPVPQTAALSICNGCHGDMYDDDARSAGADPSAPTGANNSANSTKYGNARNTNEVAGGKKGVNSIHVVKGIIYDQNHHVTTGDVVNTTIVGVGQTWRDTTVVDAILNPVSNATGRGQMPQLATWTDGKTKGASDVISCLNCHTAGHGGKASTYGSILRDIGAASFWTGTPSPNDNTARISDGRGWLNINDTLFCSDCHTLK